MSKPFRLKEINDVQHKPPRILVLCYIKTAMVT